MSQVQTQLVWGSSTFPPDRPPQCCEAVRGVRRQTEVLNGAGSDDRRRALRQDRGEGAVKRKGGVRSHQADRRRAALMPLHGSRAQGPEGNSLLEHISLILITYFMLCSFHNQQNYLGCLRFRYYQYSFIIADQHKFKPTTTETN